MRLRVENLALSGTSRTVHFEPGMNAITGGMSGGKTATVSCLRALLGADVSVIPELDGRTITGTVVIGDRRFRIIRRLVTTTTAKIDIAEVGGAGEAWRLPASQLQPGYEQTFRDWYLEMLGLPRIRVPRAPSDDASPLVPVTISDYLMYCVLRQTEIDSSVFGTYENHHKNIKRRYVFEILYGLYSPEAAGLRERLRAVTADLNALTADAGTLERILADTAFASRAQLEVEYAATGDKLQRVRAIDRQLVHRPTDPATIKLRRKVAETEAELAVIADAIHAETAAKASLESLHGQLIAQSRRLTRALVAEHLLNDFEFHTCPRCGAGLPQRGDDDTCRLCLQTPPRAPSHSSLAAEQDRVIEQVAETQTLIERSSRRLDELHRASTAQAERRRTVGQQLDQASAIYLTDQVDAIRAHAAEEATLQEHLARIDDALKLYLRLEDQTDRVAALERERDELIRRIDASRHSDPTVNARLRSLDEAFETALRDFDAPRFDTHPGSYIDRSTYLPVVDGRPFAKLQSQGVEVLVNVAHVLAHQRVALEDRDIALPNILIIDGVSSNVGHAGVDLARLRKMYSALSSTAALHPDALQIIVVDNDPPPIDGIHIALELSDTDRLVPQDNPDSGPGGAA